MYLRDLMYVINPLTNVCLFERDEDNDESLENEDCILYVGQWFKHTYYAKVGLVTDMFVSYVDHTPTLCIEVKNVSDIYEDALQNS